jgi:microcystin-dependent protein
MTEPVTPSPTLGDFAPSPVNRAVLNTTSMRELAEAMTEPPDPGAVNRRWGIVAAFNGPPDYTVDVTIGGVLVPGLAYDAAYTPTVGEVVMLDVVGTDTVVIGTTAPGAWRTGQLEPTFLSTPKAGALFCTGQAISRTTYANLWSWVTANGLAGTGKPFGTGDGSTTFTLPDLRGLVPIGAGTLGSDTYNVGDRPGAARQTLAINQMPAHTHSVSIAAHTTHTHSVGIAAHTTHSHGVSVNAHAAHDHGGTLSAGGHGLHNDGTAVTEASALAGSQDHFFSVAGGTNTINGAHAHSLNADGPTTHGVNESLAGPTTHTVSETAAGPTTHTVTETSVGGSTPLDVRQPAFVVNWLIYV